MNERGQRGNQTVLTKRRERGRERESSRKRRGDDGVDGVASEQYESSVDAHNAMGIYLAMRPGLCVCDAMRADTDRCKCANVGWARMDSVDQQELERRL
jgi:hypothetical protein